MTGTSTAPDDADTRSTGPLFGRIAAITGAASGIGAAGASLFAGAGATVVGLDLQPEGPPSVTALGAPHRSLHLDVTDGGAWRQAVDEIGRVFSRLDLLWLNAGVMSRPPGAPGSDGALQTVTAAAFDRVFGVNVGGMIKGIEAAVPLLRADGGGDIVLTASASALVPNPLDPVYAASKAALVGLTRSLAPVLETEGIRINCICPGSTDTPMVPADRKRVVDGKVVSVTYGREIQPPERIAEGVLAILERGGTGEVWAALPGSPAMPVTFQDLFTRN